jgi:hypothetical protein
VRVGIAHGVGAVAANVIRLKAIILAANVENTLRQAITKRLNVLGHVEFDELFGFEPPMGSFQNKETTTACPSGKRLTVSVGGLSLARLSSTR